MVIIGTKCQIEETVTEDLTAQAIGSGALPVFGTPFMTALMENAALTCLQAFLDEGQGSVGTFLDIKHTAPTPVGMKVTAEAEIYDANERKVMFKVRAWDERDPSAREPTPASSSTTKNFSQNATPNGSSNLPRFQQKRTAGF